LEAGIRRAESELPVMGGIVIGIAIPQVGSLILSIQTHLFIYTRSM